MTLTLSAGNRGSLQGSATLPVHQVPERVYGCIPRGELTAAGPADPQGVVSVSFNSTCQRVLVVVGSCALGHTPVWGDTHWVGCCDWVGSDLATRGRREAGRMGVRCL